MSEQDAIERRRRFARSRDPVESVRDEVAPYVDALPERHSEDLAAACRAVAATLASRPDRQCVLDWQDPRSPAAEAVWLARFRNSPLARSGRDEP